jgi:MATE family multidrug resistance protein
LTIYKYKVIGIFTSEPDVIQLASKIIPLGALYQINDCVSAITGGVLRGQGRQRLVAGIGLVAYYLIALPLAFLFAFGYGLELFGLWCGISVAIVIISFSQLYYVIRSDWEAVINESLKDALAEGHYSTSDQSDLRSVISHSFLDAAI